PDISGAMVRDKVAAACATGCDRLVSADCGCLLNIGHAARHMEAPLPVEHMASFLWRRTGGDQARAQGAKQGGRRDAAQEASQEAAQEAAQYAAQYAAQGDAR
ncbi:MAG: (Fe-S)-binding protein, partial [Pseudomonadota bacterium]